MCVACRERDAKRALVRVVRTPDGAVEVDPTGKKNGRGAYLCDRPECWGRAVETPVLARALKVEIGPEASAGLRAYAATLTTPERGDGTPPAEGTS